MAVGDKIKVLCKYDDKRYFKNNWGIINVYVTKVIKGEPVINSRGLITVVGVMPTPDKEFTYQIVAEEVDDPNFGTQYKIHNMSSIIDFDVNDQASRRKYLTKLFTKGQVDAMYDALSDPFEALNTNDTISLVQVKGCGIQTAMRWVDRFQENYGFSRLYMELEEYKLTTNMMKNLIDAFGSADLAIEQVKDNPYNLCKCKGIGWKTADEKALEAGLDQYCVERISSFIMFYLRQVADEGNSYVCPDILMDAICENIGNEVPDLAVAEAIHSIEGLWYNKDKSKIGLQYYRNLAENIARELHRLSTAENTFKFDNWENVIREIEEEQGWELTDEQVDAVKKGLDNNVITIVGYGGTGKSSCVQGITRVLSSYGVAVCALSGRAAARIGETTGEEGYTIHRLLGFPSRDQDAKQMFKYHQDNKLPYDIIVLDEASMVSASLFYFLVRSIKTGAKLICLGDDGQLESIGEGNVLYDMIHSPYIPTVKLTKIHRQAAKSGIITESIKIRKGQQIIPQDWSGSEVRGELEDFYLDCYSDKDNTYFKVMQHVSRELQNIDDILDLQVICPTKRKGTSCTSAFNDGIQALYNPPDRSKNELDVFCQGLTYTIREGDKVINRKNNYKITSADGTTSGIFNGDIGIVTSVDPKYRMVIVDFVGKGEFAISKDQLAYLELAYAITVHSSQGSQMQTAIVAIDYGAYSMLTKELVYTAITRAQSKCILVAQNTALRYATSQEGVNTKLTHLQDCLEEVYNPKLVF